MGETDSFHANERGREEEPGAELKTSRGRWAQLEKSVSGCTGEEAKWVEQGN
jgi:hypothetical protein